METTDAELVERCRKGDSDAYGELIQRHQDAVFNLLMKLTGNREDAADLTQEALIRGYRKLSAYNCRFSFKNWIITIGVNLAKNRFRSIFRRRRAEEQAGTATDCHVDDNPQIEAVNLALAQLPEKLRLPLVLKHMEGFSYEEIAGALHIGVSAAKMRVLRAREEFVRRLES